jgi:hypothetical protein
MTKRYLGIVYLEVEQDANLLKCILNELDDLASCYKNGDRMSNSGEISQLTPVCAIVNHEIGALANLKRTDLVAPSEAVCSLDCRGGESALHLVAVKIVALKPSQNVAYCSQPLQLI